jgi:hypothetical protein
MCEFLDGKDVSERRYIECEDKEAALDMAGIVHCLSCGDWLGPTIRTISETRPLARHMPRWKAFRDLCGQ